MNVEVLRTERIELVNIEGEVRAWMGVGEDGNPGLVLHVRNGVKRVVLAVDGDGCGLHVTDRDGKARAHVAVNNDRVTVMLQDAQERGRAALYVESDGTPYVILLDEEGNIYNLASHPPEDSESVIE